YLLASCGKPVESLWKACGKKKNICGKKKSICGKKNDLQKVCGKLGYFSTDFPQEANSANPLYQGI
ncbi:MAG: hypothetical protein WBG63_04680, partial [Phormidesmis sp.]